MFTRRELETYLRKQWMKQGHELSDGERIGVSISELVEHSTQRNSKLEKPYVDLWIAVLDEFISWQISLLAVFYSERRMYANFTEFDRSVISVLMKIVGDSTAIRHLVLLGFDTSARILLRSTAEYMELYVALLDDPELSKEFIRTDTPEASAEFWRQHLARGGFRKKMYAAWRKFFSNETDHEAAASFANWGRSSNRILSGLSHPSYFGGVLTAVPFKTEYQDENWLGIWGDKADGSVDTIAIYSNFMFPMLLLSHEFPFNGLDPYMAGGAVTFDPASEHHRHVKIGRRILGSLILSLHKDSNEPRVFPEIDMSIWPKGVDEDDK